jgi:hypothetical protein
MGSCFVFPNLIRVSLPGAQVRQWQLDSNLSRFAGVSEAGSSARAVFACWEECEIHLAKSSAERQNPPGARPDT